MSSEAETSLDVYAAGMIRDSSTALRSARNDKLAGRSLYRGAQNTLFDLEQPIANNLADGPEKSHAYAQLPRLDRIIKWNA